MVQMVRLELTRVAPQIPETCASANFATSAKYKYYMLNI